MNRHGARGRTAPEMMIDENHNGARSRTAMGGSRGERLDAVIGT